MIGGNKMKKMKKMLKAKYIILGLLLLMVAMNGCNEWLDIEPENDLIKQEFWNSKEDVEATLAATYDALRGTFIKSFIYGELRGDMVSFSGGGDHIPDYNRIAENDITSTNSVVRWDEYYKTINLANTVMYYAPIVQEKDNTFSDGYLNSIEAEMLFIRSLCHFYLTRLWKDVPIMIRPSISDTVDIYQPKSSEREVLNQIVKDLKRASALAYTTQYAKIPEFYKGRANKYSIQALLADVLLWSERYDEAIVYCDSLINTKLFRMESRNNWFKIYYPGNSLIESFFEIQFDDELETQENPMYISLINSIKVETKLKNVFEKDDIRLGGNNDPVYKYYGINKSTERSDNERDANFIYYRYADILLIKAEALAEINKIEDANYLVRQVAERAGQVHNSVLEYEGFMTALMNERAREFAVEGKRWFDLLRWAKKRKFENKKIIMDILLSRASNAQMRAILRSKLTDTMAYYLPIFEDDIIYNSKLEQNPYYER